MDLLAHTVTIIVESVVNHISRWIGIAINKQYNCTWFIRAIFQQNNLNLFCFFSYYLGIVIF